MPRPIPASATGPDRPRTCLIISPDREDRAFLAGILRRLEWSCYEAGTGQEARALLRRHSFPVVIAAEQLADGEWSKALLAPRHTPRPPMLVITSLQPSESLYAKAAHLGAYDVMLKPVNEEDAVHVVTMAWLAWLEAASGSMAGRR